LKNEVRGELIDLKTQFFTFKKIVLPKCDLFSSTVYAHPRKLSFSSRDNAEKYIAQLNPNNKYYSPHGITIFFNLIPEKETLIGIIGWPNKDIHGLDLEEVNIDFLNSKLAEKFISDVLIKRVETWGLSISLWRNWKELGVDKKVIELIHKYLPPEMKSEKVDFNLFA
jgi:hypothetical protein